MQHHVIDIPARGHEADELTECDICDQIHRRESEPRHQVHGRSGLCKFGTDSAYAISRTIVEDEASSEWSG